MTREQWDAIARDQANDLQRQPPGEPRGAYATDSPGVCVAYALDDYAHDHRARLCVTLLRQRLHDAGLVELGFGTSDDGGCWAMAVQTNDVDALARGLLDARRIALGRDSDGTVG